MSNIILIPNLGFEYKFKNKFGFLINGYWTHINWGKGEHTYRIWGINPELRYYIGKNKHFYIGATSQIGEINIKLYEFGAQGNFLAIGLATGYQLYLKNNLLLDFTLGLGYLDLKYDKYSYYSGKNIKGETINKGTISPIKFAINLTWRLN